MVKEANTYPIISKNNIGTVGKTDKSQTSKETVDTSKNNKTGTLNTMDKSRSTPRSNLYNKILHIEKPLEINIYKYNKYVYYSYRQGESLVSVTPDQQRIPCKNKINKTPYSSVIRKEPIEDTVNPRKISKEDTVTDLEKDSLHKTPPYFLHKLYYEGDTDENNCCSDDSHT